jgi:hypothetical protein
MEAHRIHDSASHQGANSLKTMKLQHTGRQGVISKTPWREISTTPKIDIDRGA